MAKQRIDKLLSHQGFGTRKDIKKLLRQADVFLNGKQIYDPSITIDPQTDVLTIDDEQIDFTEHYYIMMNKVAHTVSSNKDGEHQTVFDLGRTCYKVCEQPYVGRKEEYCLFDFLRCVGYRWREDEGC